MEKQKLPEANWFKVESESLFSHSVTQTTEISSVILFDPLNGL